jgi:hypothetical protein
MEIAPVGAAAPSRAAEVPTLARAVRGG